MLKMLFFLSKQGVKDQQDNKQTKTCIVGISEGEERKMKDQEIMAGKYPQIDERH